MDFWYGVDDDCRAKTRVWNVDFNWIEKLNLGLILLGETVLITLLGVLSGILLSFPFVLYLNRNPIRFTGEMAKAYEKFGFEPVIPTAVDSSIFIPIKFRFIINILNRNVSHLAHS